MEFKKWLSKNLIMALLLNFLIFFVTAFITADLKNPDEAYIAWLVAFILMIIITTTAYITYRLGKNRFQNFKHNLPDSSI